MQIGMHIEGGDEVLRDLERAPAEVKQRAPRIVQATSFALEKRIKNEMPVDKGRARASWGHWTPGDIVQADPDASRADAHWETRDGGLTTEQGSNVDYIEALNDGHSKQAPAGFIDKAVAVAQRALIQGIDQMLRGLGF
jgi:hypothetical protein